jgi:NAD+ kinase
MTHRFRRISLIGRYQDPLVAEAIHAVAKHLLARGHSVCVDSHMTPRPQGCEGSAETTLTHTCDLVISIGGDGTLLRAAALMPTAAKPLLGINRGRLGFLADIAADGMHERIDAVLAGRYDADERLRLEGSFVDEHGVTQRLLALNDIVIQKHDTGRMLDFETRIDGRFVNSHGGDGLVVATPTGSTGYALSCGGPILTPNLRALVLAPISPHTLSDRPIVVHQQATIEVRLTAKAPMSAAITVDGSMRGLMRKDAVLTIRVSDSPVTLLHPSGHDHFGILRAKLHWGRNHRLENDDA